MADEIDELQAERNEYRMLCQLLLEPGTFKRYKELTDEFLEDVARLHAAAKFGETYIKIASKYPASKSTIHQWVAEARRRGIMEKLPNTDKRSQASRARQQEKKES